MSTWEAVEKRSGRYGVIEPTGPKTMRIIAEDLSEEEARRIAASSDLLGAAVWMLNAESRDESYDVGDATEAELALMDAIAKAKGLDEWTPVGDEAGRR